MEGILTTSSSIIIIIKAAKPVAVRADAPEFALAGQAITIHVVPAEPTRHALHLAVTSETGTLVEARRTRPSGGPITIDGLAGGAYTIDVDGTEPASPFAPVSNDILIWETRSQRLALDDNEQRPGCTCATSGPGAQRSHAAASTTSRLSHPVSSRRAAGPREGCFCYTFYYSPRYAKGPLPSGKGP